jgi:hypothetical protein
LGVRKKRKIKIRWALKEGLCRWLSFSEQALNPGAETEKLKMKGIAAKARRYVIQKVPISRFSLCIQNDQGRRWHMHRMKSNSQ